MGDLKEYADRLKFEIMAADFLTTEDREMVFDLIEKVLGEETIIEILTAFFGKSIAGYSLDTLKHFILRSFEIRSDNSSVRSIAEDVDFIQRAVFARSFGNGKQEVPE